MKNLFREYNGLMTLARIYQSLSSDLSYIEETLEKAIDRDVPLLHEASIHLLKAGGKRIRPIFVLLSGKFGCYDLEQLAKVAATLELIHMATLVHDDVIDDAETRRGRPTVKAKWDNRIAMFTGDYIFAKALMLVTQLKDPRVHRILSSAIVEMCKGEIEQIQDFFRCDLNLRQYLRRIKRKTALLIAVSCRLGAIVSGAGAEEERRLGRYGYYVGMAFQITDDILDYTGSEETLGKPAGGDLRQGNVTLPAIYALRHSPHRERLKQWIAEQQIDAHLAEVLDIVRGSGGIEHSRMLCRIYLDKARQELAALPECEARELLWQIAEFIGERQY